MAEVQKEDLPDADYWVTRAVLLGIEVQQYQDDIDDHVWRYGCKFNGFGYYADWPGRAAKKAVEAAIQVI